MVEKICYKSIDEMKVGTLNWCERFIWIHCIIVERKWKDLFS